MLAAAIAAEVSMIIEQHGSVNTRKRKSTVARYEYLPEHLIQMKHLTIEIKVQRIRDRCNIYYF